MKTWRVFIAEIRKSHQHNYKNRMVYFSLLVWPALSFVATYYGFKPFNLTKSSPLARFMDVDLIILFLLIGYLGYIFFWSLVQSAWQMSYERQSGTLEIIFLSPASRVAVMMARATGNLIEAVWMFSLFCGLVVLVTGHAGDIHWVSVPISLLFLTLAAAVWGCFLNVLFLFSRDAGFLYTIFQEPMEFFSGVKIPVQALPIWGQTFGLIFPLTYVLNIVRKMVIDGVPISELGVEIAMMSGVLIVLFVASLVLVKKAETHAKDTGNMVLF